MIDRLFIKLIIFGTGGASDALETLRVVIQKGCDGGLDDLAPGRFEIGECLCLLKPLERAAEYVKPIGEAVKLLVHLGQDGGEALGFARVGHAFDKVRNIKPFGAKDSAVGVLYQLVHDFRHEKRYLRLV